MGELWRSQEMQMLQLYIQREAAHDTVDELGALSIVQFRDLNASVNAFQRNFVNEIRRCDELERKLRYIHDQIMKEQAANPALLEGVRVGGETAPMSRFLSFDELEPYLESAERDLRHMATHNETIMKNYNELLEFMHVLKLDSHFFEQQEIAPPAKAADETRVSLMAEEGGPRYTRIEFLTGVVLRTRGGPFERVLWRSLHGNLYTRMIEIEEPILDPASGEHQKKNVFIVFYHGEQSLTKIRKVAEAFGARVFPCPEERREREQMLGQITGRVDDMRAVLDQSAELRRRLLVTLSESLPFWAAFARKEKSIYTTLNCFNYDPSRACLIAEGWCPTSRIDDVGEAINRASKKSAVEAPSLMNIVKTTEEPPTYFPLNKMTSAFQAIVDAYGVARYREVNPGVFTTVTFPFLFSIMFGDWGHSLLIFMTALAFIYWEQKLSKIRLNEIVQMLFDGRYLLMLMSIFSIYTGMLYNECFCVSFNFFGSRWYGPDGEPCQHGSCIKDPHSTYPFGADPMWRGAENELFYYNSLKMKLSIIYGVVQMLLGVVLSYFNHRNTKNVLGIIFDFIPQMMFLSCIFGYLVILIILKWMTPPKELLNQPYLINVVIDMFLQFPHPPADELMFHGQFFLQNVLVITALLSVFMMLVPKPILLWRHHKAIEARKAAGEHVEEVHDPHDDHGDENGEFSLVDAYILQSIHTIEFCLGCISHTASYLRLWALSLAHSELSVVFYEQVFLLTVKAANFFVMFVGFACWGGATIGILLFMEALSAFLHALRLHWVEFQSKFYHGDGYAFVPLSYPVIMSQVSEEYSTEPPESS
eukprot:m51a1_g2909 putative vacuolar proton atpase 100-kda subunit (818) ;mRNA; r:492493-495865